MNFEYWISVLSIFWQNPKVANYDGWFSKCKLYTLVNCIWIQFSKIILQHSSEKFDKKVSLQKRRIFEKNSDENNFKIMNFVIKIISLRSMILLLHLKHEMNVQISMKFSTLIGDFWLTSKIQNW